MRGSRDIVEAASTALLRQIAEDFELDVGDRRKRSHLERAITTARPCKPEVLLDLLTVRDVKQVCEAAGVDPRARKTVLIERLLGELPQDSVSPPQAPL